MTGAWKVEGGKVMLFARVTPNASKNEVGGLRRGADGEERLSIRVTAAPDKGRANAAVVKLLSKTLGLPKSSIVLVSGEKDRSKSFALGGDSDEIVGKLASFSIEAGRGES